MDTIQIKDKLFTVSIKEQEIQKEVIRVANEINRDLAGKNPLFLSVLNGSGLTMQRLLETLGTRNPEAIHIASLLVKPEKLKVNLNIEYVAMEIPNDFIVGYGLDYDQKYRNLPWLLMHGSCQKI